MTRLVVVLPLLPLHLGDQFTVRDWPLHVTVLQPFDTHAAIADVIAAIASVASGHAELTAVAGHGELFGRRHDVPVTVLEESDELTRLHDALVDAIRPLAASPQDKAFTGSRFRPHITTKHHARVHEGERVRLAQLALVDMAPRSSPGGRSVLATITFGPS